MQLLASILLLQPEAAEGAFIQHGFLEMALRTMLGNHFNNCLHNCVSRMIGFILLDPRVSGGLRMHLFQDVKLTELLVSSFKDNAAGLAKERVGVRRGYMGHLKTIADQIKTATTKYSNVAAFVEGA